MNDTTKKAARKVKLSKTQAALWEQVRNALPCVQGVDSRFTAAHEDAEGLVVTAANKNETVAALEKAGLVEVVKMGGRMRDLLRIVADRGELLVTISPINDKPGVYATPRIEIRTPAFYTIISSQGRSLEAVAEEFRAAGRVVTIGQPC